MRKEMGKNGRMYALEHYTVLQQTDKIAATLYAALENFNRKAEK
jgi:hypothetical protein